MRAKQSGTGRALVESYNLLGDPAMRLALPDEDLPMRSEVREDSVLIGAGGSDLEN